MYLVVSVYHHYRTHVCNKIRLKVGLESKYILIV